MSTMPITRCSSSSAIPFRPAAAQRRGPGRRRTPPAVFGVGVPGGQQVCFASLVDLNTGNILWFNTLASGFGDLREPDSAEEATEALFDEIPL